MFGIGLLEIIIVAVCLLVFFKPHEIPELLKTAGKAFATLRGYANNLRSEIDSLGSPTGEMLDLEGKKQPTYDLDDFIDEKKVKTSKKKPTSKAKPKTKAKTKPKPKKAKK